MIGRIVAPLLRPREHVWRARIGLLSSDGFGTSAMMSVTGKSKTCVWHWQERLMHEGVDDQRAGHERLRMPHQ